MKIIETTLPGVLIIEPEVYIDQRGWFKESYNLRKFEEAGIVSNFVQDNASFSEKGVLRGLHFQRTRPQGKLVTCASGAVFDVVVDIDPNSSTCGLHVAVELTAENHRQLWVPPGFAHGFCVLSDRALFQYKCTEFYDPADEGGVLWSDPQLEIDWPIKKPVVSAKDSILPLLSEALSHSADNNS